MGENIDQLYNATIQYLEPSILRDWILSPQSIPSRKHVLVIDVRGSDYKYGHITNSVNYPCRSFQNDSIKGLVQSLNSLTDTILVFHCMRSENRGPKCAKRFVRWLCNYFNVFESNISTKELKLRFEKLPKIYVLKGGLKRWNELYGDDDRLMKPI